MTRMIDVDLLIAEFEKVYPLATNEMGGVVNKRIYDIINSIPVVAGSIPYNHAGDLISREALKAKMKEADAEAIDYEMLVAMYEKLVNDAPAVEPERPQGAWIQAKGEDGIEIYRKNICSRCNKVSVEKYSFCPNCGTQMLGGGAE